MKTLLICLVLITALCPAARAQIVLTMEDDLPVLQSRLRTTYFASDAPGTTITLGGAGAGKVFAFTGFSYSSERGQGIDAQPVSVSGMFAQATHRAMKFGGSFPDNFVILYYYALNQTGRYYLGRFSEWPTPPSETNFVWSPPGVDYPFPCTLGSEWMDDVVVDVFDAGTGIKTGSGKAWRTAKVEASGLLRLPLGDFECLRILRKENTDFGRSSFHEFVTKTNIRVVLGVDTLEEDSDTPRIKYLKVTQYDTATSALRAPAVQEAFSLRDNHPDPFTRTTSIDYSLHAGREIRLSVFDVLGREITVLSDGYRSAGMQNAVWDGRDRTGIEAPPGLYFCRLAARDRSSAAVRTIKMILLK